MSFELRPVEKSVKTRHTHGPALVRVADHVARGDKPFVIHKRHGYQTTNAFPKIRFEFDVSEGSFWAMRDRVDQNLAGYEVCVRSLSAEAAFKLQIGHYDTLLASSPNQDMHVLDFGLGGLMLSQVSVGQQIKFAGLEGGATVHVIAEIYPSCLLYKDVVVAGKPGKSVSGPRRLYIGGDGSFTQPALSVLFRGIEHYYANGTYGDRAEAARMFPTFYEFTPVITNGNKAQLANLCPELDEKAVKDLPVSTFATVLQAMRPEAPETYYVLQKPKRPAAAAPTAAAPTAAAPTSAAAGGKEQEGKEQEGKPEEEEEGEEATVQEQEARVLTFATLNQGIKYAQRALVKLGTSVEVSTTDILQQIQSFTPFSVFTGVNNNIEIKSKPMGHLNAVTFPKGLPINAYNKCFVHFADTFPSLVYGVPDAEFRVVKDDGSEAVVKRTKDPKKAMAELARLGTLFKKGRVVIRSPVTFVCEVVGDEHLDTLMHLNVLAVSPQNVIVEHADQKKKVAHATDPEKTCEK